MQVGRYPRQQNPLEQDSASIKSKPAAGKSEVASNAKQILQVCLTCRIAKVINSLESGINLNSCRVSYRHIASFVLWTWKWPVVWRAGT